MKLDVDYVVNENGVMIVDAFTGRLMPGRRFSDGLHQAIEAKGRRQHSEGKTRRSPPSPSVTTSVCTASCPV